MARAIWHPGLVEQQGQVAPVGQEASQPSAVVGNAPGGDRLQAGMLLEDD